MSLCPPVVAAEMLVLVTRETGQWGRARVWPEGTMVVVGVVM